MASKQKTNQDAQKEPETDQEKTGDNNKQPINDRSWIKKDYRKLRSTLHEHKDKMKALEVERTDFQPMTHTSLNAYANTSVGDMAMKTNHNPVKCEPFGLRPGEVIADEAYRTRDTTLKTVLPAKSLEMDTRFKPGVYHTKEAETENEEKAEEKSKDKSKGKEKAPKEQQTAQNKNADGKDGKTPAKEQQSSQNKKIEGKDSKATEKQGKGGKEEPEKDKEEDKEPSYMKIPYQLPRERPVNFKRIQIEDKRTKQPKSKDQLNFDDLKLIRQNIKEQKLERSAKRLEENYVMTQRDWKEMDFDSLYDLRLEGDKQRLHFPLVRYFGAYKKGSRDAAKELAEPLNPDSQDPDEMKKLEALVTNFHRAQAN